MKKILIIYPRFSQNNIMGPLRLRGLAKYLPQFGWEATILTLKPGENYISPYNVIEIESNETNTSWTNFFKSNKSKTNPNLYSHSPDNNLLKSLLRLIKGMFLHSGYDKSWYVPAIKEGSKLLEKEDFDAILSSSPPVSSHLAARELKKRFEIPWIADFRDLWTQNPYTSYHSFIRNFFEKKLEINTLKNADAITTSSSYSAEDLKSFHEREEVYPLLNGFDSDNIENIHLSNNLNLTYTGSFYNGKRDPELLFKALNELNDEDQINLSDFSIDFYSPVENWLKGKIKDYGLENVVKMHGIVSREDILNIQRETQILLLLSWNNPKEKGVIPGKIYEYLAANRPILSIGPTKGLVKDLIESTNSGIHLYDYTSIKITIKNIYDEFKTKGKIEYKGIPEEINKYSQKEMAKKFALILDEISNSN